MIETRAGAGQAEADALSPAGLLASIRQARSVEDAAAARQLDLAARWADLHPPESIHSAAAFTVPPPRTPPLLVRGAGGVSASGQDDAGHVQPMP